MPGLRKREAGKPTLLSKSDAYSGAGFGSSSDNLVGQEVGRTPHYAGTASNQPTTMAIQHRFDSVEERIPKAGQRLAIKTGRRLLFLDAAEIDWIEACGNHVKFHVGRESYLVRAGIGQLAEALSGAGLVRIHRSTIVHLKKVRELTSRDNGDYVVTLSDGKQLSSSRGYRAWLEQLVKNCYPI
jgi:DNA-binding LytR/AlgR family response regulator